MPIYMDVHDGLGDATPDDVAAAHQRDLEIQDEFGVRFLSYWVNAPGGKAFCLVESPDADSVKKCHMVAHGLMPHELIEVNGTMLNQFLGDTETDDGDRVMVQGEYDTAIRVIMFTDIAGSTDVSTEHGDRTAVELVERHDELVRGALRASGGREIKHTGDGVLASFTSVSGAIEASMGIQRGRSNGGDETAALRIKIGISAGEPVENNNDIYGASVNMAARICAHAGADQTLASSAVRDLAIGKPYDFINVGDIALKGFADPVRLFEIPWQEAAG